MSPARYNDIVIQAGVEQYNGYEDGGREYVTNGDWDRVDEEVYVKTSGMDSQHYQIQPSTAPAQEPKTIYITFDKSNLQPSGHDSMQVVHRPGNAYTERRVIQERPQPELRRFTTMRPVTVPAPLPLRPVAVPFVPQPQPRLVYRSLPAPQPQPVFVRPPPQPVVMRPPPQPVYFQAPRPQPMYVRRMMSPPPMGYPMPAPMMARTRARSMSPIHYRQNGGRFQPKWGGRRPASENGLRMSRRDMFLNERAFSQRMATDSRMAPAPTAYPYGGYNHPGFYMYDKPTTKSNPRYSSSDSDSDNDRRMSRRSPRR